MFFEDPYHIQGCINQYVSVMGGGCNFWPWVYAKKNPLNL